MTQIRSQNAAAASFLMPARDAAATIDEALASLAGQTERRWEAVIVDDGSVDGTPERVARWARRDERIRLVEAPREGIVPALRRGLESCRAPIVARMDADDVAAPRRLELQLDALADPSLAAVGGRVRLFPRQGLGPGMRAYERWLNAIDSPEAVAREAFIECPIAHPTLAVRTTVLRSLDYRDQGWPEDYDLVLRLLAAGHRLGVVPEIVLDWRHDPGRASQTHPAYRHDRFTACKAAALASTFLGGGDSYVLWGYGGTGRALRKALAANGKSPRRIVEVHPRRIGNTIGGAPVVAPESLDLERDRPLVVSVAGDGPRTLIRTDLTRRGWCEGPDYVCAA